MDFQLRRLCQEDLLEQDLDAEDLDVDNLSNIPVQRTPVVLVDEDVDSPLARAIARQVKKRVCLRCNQLFESEGSHNRLCSWCKRFLHWDPDDEFDPFPLEQRIRYHPRGRVSAGLRSAV